MKKEKLSLEKMKNVLSRDEMRMIMAGSGGTDTDGCHGGSCGIYQCYTVSGDGRYYSCDNCCYC